MSYNHFGRHCLGPSFIPQGSAWKPQITAGRAVWFKKKDFKNTSLLYYVGTKPLSNRFTLTWNVEKTGQKYFLRYLSLLYIYTVISQVGLYKNKLEIYHAYSVAAPGCQSWGGQRFLQGGLLFPFFFALPSPPTFSPSIFLIYSKRISGAFCSQKWHVS